MAANADFGQCCQCSESTFSFTSAPMGRMSVCASSVQPASPVWPVRDAVRSAAGRAKAGVHVTRDEVLIAKAKACKWVSSKPSSDSASEDVLHLELGELRDALRAARRQLDAGSMYYVNICVGL